MQTVQSSVLVLYTSLLTASATTKYGTANVNFTDVIFSNINIRQILGDNYDKFYKFNLVLTALTIPVTTGGTILPDNGSAVMFYMSGLPFDTGSSYSTITKTTTNTALFATAKINVPNNTGLNSAVAIYPPTFYNTFLRPTSDMVDIAIGLRSSVATFTAGIPSFLFTPLPALYPRFAYSFSITPVLNTALAPLPSRTEQSLVNRQRLFK